MWKFIAMLVGGVGLSIPAIVGRVLLALGVGYAAFTGINTALDWLKAEAIASLQGAPANVAIIMSLLKVDRALSVIFSAVAIRLTIKGLSSAAGGTIKRVSVK